MLRDFLNVIKEAIAAGIGVGLALSITGFVCLGAYILGVYAYKTYMP